MTGAIEKGLLDFEDVFSWAILRAGLPSHSPVNCVTLNVNKDSETGDITGYSDLSVSGVSGVKCKSVSGNITASNCELVLSLTKALIRITVEFQSY